MLQWTGGSRRKVATSRKSTYSRQKQYFEQRKRQRQASGQENHANRSDMEVLYNAEPRSLDVLNLINLAVASQQVSTELTVSENYDVAKVSDDSLLGKVIGSSSTVSEGARSAQLTKPSDSDLPQVCQTDSYKCGSHVNEWKMQGSVPEHTSCCVVDTLNEKKEKPQIEAAVLDLLDDEPINRRSIPEAHAALLVEGLGKIGSQTPAHSPRMQNRFSYKGIPMSSKPSKRVHSSALESSHSQLDRELNAMTNDFRVSPLCNKGGPWAYFGTKTTTHKLNVAPLPPYSLADQIEKTSIKRKGFDACLLAPNEKYQNDNFGYLERHSIEESYDATSQNQRLPFEEYPFLNNSTKTFGLFETTDAEVKDTFLGTTRNFWEGGEKLEASATSTPHFRRSTTLEEEMDPSFFWDSGGNADGVFDAPAWNFLPTEDFHDNISLLSENSNSSSAVRDKTSSSFGIRSMKPGKGRTNSKEKIQKFSEERNFMGSQDENIFTGFDDTVWGNKPKGESAFKTLGAENTFFLDQTFPSKAASTLDPFNSFTIRKSTASSAYKAMNQDDHFDLFFTPKSKFEIPSGCEPPSDFMMHEMFSKQSGFDLNSHVPIKPSSKPKGYGQCPSSAEDFCKGMHCTHLPKYQEYNEDRGSSGKPQPKDAEKNSTSSGNAESAAGAESLGKVSEHEESKNEIPEPSSSPRVEKSNDEAEVLPTLMEEFPSQIQNYVRSKLNQFQGHSPVSSYPSNEESKTSFEPKSNKFQSEGGSNGDASYQVMLQSYVLQLLCVQKVLMEASEKDVKRKV